MHVLIRQLGGKAEKHLQLERASDLQAAHLVWVWDVLTALLPDRIGSFKAIHLNAKLNQIFI